MRAWKGSNADLFVADVAEPVTNKGKGKDTDPPIHAAPVKGKGKVDWAKVEAITAQAAESRARQSRNGKDKGTGKGKANPSMEAAEPVKGKGKKRAGPKSWMDLMKPEDIVWKTAEDLVSEDSSSMEEVSVESEAEANAKPLPLTQGEAMKDMKAAAATEPCQASRIASKLGGFTSTSSMDERWEDSQAYKAWMVAVQGATLTWRKAKAAAEERGEVLRVMDSEEGRAWWAVRVGKIMAYRRSPQYAAQTAKTKEMVEAFKAQAGDAWGQGFWNGYTISQLRESQSCTASSSFEQYHSFEQSCNAEEAAERAKIFLPKTMAEAWEMEEWEEKRQKRLRAKQKQKQKPRSRSGMNLRMAFSRKELKAVMTLLRKKRR